MTTMKNDESESTVPQVTTARPDGRRLRSGVRAGGLIDDLQSPWRRFPLPMPEPTPEI